MRGRGIQNLRMRGSKRAINMYSNGTKNAIRASWPCRRERTKAMREEAMRLDARKTEFAVQMLHAIQPKLNMYGLSTVSSDSTLAECVLMMILDDKSKRNVVSELGANLLGVGEDNPKVVAFVTWLFAHLRSRVAPEGSSTREDHREIKKLPAHRLHMVGRGKVGKNFSGGTRAQRNRLRVRDRSSKLAKALFQDLSRHHLVPIPAFVARAAFVTKAAVKFPPHHHTYRKCLGVISKAYVPQQGNLCHLLRLAPEIRNMIYEYTFASNADSNDEIDLVTAGPPTIDLPLTCKQIGEECGPMFAKLKNYWRESKFCINASARAYTRICGLPERDCNKITNIRAVITTLHGDYSAVWNQRMHHWVVTQLGAANSPDRGVEGRKFGMIVGGRSQILIVHQAPDPGHMGRFYLYRNDNSHGLKVRLEAHMTEEHTPLKNQLIAMTDWFSDWR